jgi:hypothetical protein
MHTTESLTFADFAFTVGSHKASLEDVFPGSMSTIVSAS